MNKYIAEIDGLRALAILAVIMFHAGTGASGGFVGVDIFFVISGYLITRQLSFIPSFSIRNVLAFWLRRIRRIVPALLAVSIFSFIISLLLLMPAEQREFSKSLLAAILFFANYHYAAIAGYFDTPSLAKPLLHTWSLGLEIQFYLLMPIASAFLLRGKNRQLPVLAVALILSLVLSAYDIGHGKSTIAFYGFPTRLWEFLTGSIVAVSNIRISKKYYLSYAIQISAIALAALPAFLYSRYTPFPGLYALAPCLGTAILIAVFESESRGPARAIFGNRYSIWLGKHSYSIYLWHWPLLVFASYILGRHTQSYEGILVLALAVLLSVPTLRYVETPFLEWKNKTPPDRKRLYLIMSAVFILCIVSALSSLASKGFTSRLSAAAEKYAAGSTDVAPDAEHCHTISAARIANNEPCSLGTDHKKTVISPRIVVWGDSHAHALYGLFDKMAQDRNIQGAHASRSACPPIMGVEVATHSDYECRDFNTNMVKYINEQNPQIVVLVAYWSLYADGFEPYSLDIGAPPLLIEHIGDVSDVDNSRKLFRTKLEETIKSIARPGRRIWILEQFPESTSDIPQGLARAAMFPFLPENYLRPRAADVERRQAFVNSVFSDLGLKYGVNVLNTHAWLCHSDWCRISEAGRSLYRDSNHLSNYGAMRIEPVMMPIFDGIFGNNPVISSPD